jgi:two-component system sensor histidine kinase/response regulator
MSESSTKPKILAVDDKPENLFALEKLLRKLDVEVVMATSGNEALALTIKNKFCLAIVDVQMPEMDGYELVELLRGNPETASMPVIFISAIYSDEYHHRKGYDAGAVDFLSKPFVPEILLSKIRVFLDLYDQRTKMEDLARQNEFLYQLEEIRSAELAELNASKDKFFSIISHDLRTPFNGLIGPAQLLMMELEESGDIAAMELAETILKSARCAHRLLENLLSWSMIQQGVLEAKPHMVSLADLTQSVIDMLGETAVQKNIDIMTVVEPEVSVFADENMLRTILRNMLSNAIKFTEEGGKVTIFAHPHLQIEEVDQESDQFVEISVVDTGVGINPEDLEKLFKIDEQLSTIGTSKEVGAGLGLILCKEMVELNGGTLQVESIPGRGSKISFTLVEAKDEHLLETV